MVATKLDHHSASGVVPPEMKPFESIMEEVATTASTTEEAPAKHAREAFLLREAHPQTSIYLTTGYPPPHPALALRPPPLQGRDILRYPGSAFPSGLAPHPPGSARLSKLRGVWVHSTAVARPTPTARPCTLPRTPSRAQLAPSKRVSRATFYESRLGVRGPPKLPLGSYYAAWATAARPLAV